MLGPTLGVLDSAVTEAGLCPAAQDITPSSHLLLSPHLSTPGRTTTYPTSLNTITFPQEALPEPSDGSKCLSTSPPPHRSFQLSPPSPALARLSRCLEMTVGPSRAGSRSGLSCHCIPSIKREIRKRDVGTMDSNGQDRHSPLTSPLTDRSDVSGTPWTQGLPRTLCPSFFPWLIPLIPQISAPMSPPPGSPP